MGSRLEAHYVNALYFFFAAFLRVAFFLGAAFFAAFLRVAFFLGAVFFLVTAFFFVAIVDPPIVIRG
jgi:hypothetical protein